MSRNIIRRIIEGEELIFEVEDYNGEKKEVTLKEYRKLPSQTKVRRILLG